MSLINNMLLELDARQDGANEAIFDITDRLHPVPASENSGDHTTRNLSLIILIILILAGALYTFYRQPVSIDEYDTSNAISTTVIEQPRTNIATSHKNSIPPSSNRTIEHTQLTTITPDTTTSQNNPVENLVQLPPVTTATEFSDTRSNDIKYSDTPTLAPAGLQINTAGETSAAESGSYNNKIIKKNSRYTSAVYLLNQGRFAEGIELLTETLDIDSGNIEVRTLLSRTLLQQQQFRKADKLLSAGLERDSNNSDFAYLLARSKIEQGQHDLAIAILNQANVNRTLDAEPTALLALLFQQTGRYTEAAELYRLALSRQPTQGKWWLGLGISLEANKDWDDALKSYRIALDDPDLESGLQAYARQRHTIVLEHLRADTASIAAESESIVK